MSHPYPTIPLGVNECQSLAGNFSGTLCHSRCLEGEVSVNAKRKSGLHFQAYLGAANTCARLPKRAVVGPQALSRAVAGQPSAKKTQTELNHKPGIIMIKHVVLLTAAVGLLAQSSVFAADPTPAPSPAMENAAPGASPSPTARKTLRQKRVERRHTRRTTRHERREARKAPKTEATPAATPAQ
jgi:hypothetical protein